MKPKFKNTLKHTQNNNQINNKQELKKNNPTYIKIGSHISTWMMFKLKQKTLNKKIIKKNNIN